jgi:hypothetical protein
MFEDNLGFFGYLKMCVYVGVFSYIPLSFLQLLYAFYTFKIYDFSIAIVLPFAGILLGLFIGMTGYPAYYFVMRKGLIKGKGKGKG